MEFRVVGRTVFAGTGGRVFDPARPVVVFVHGAGMDHTVWPLQARWFAHHGHGVLAVDLPGHGRSEGPALETVEEMGEFLIALAGAARAKTFSLIGHSMGALAALAAASMAPGRVGRLALLGVSSPMRVHPDLLAAAAAGQALARELVVSWGHGRAAHLGGNRAPGLWMLGGGLRLLEAGPAGVLGIDLLACNSHAGAEAAAARLACPTLVLCGSADLMTPPKAAAKLASLVKDSRVVTLSGAGHMMMVERPDATLDALKSFFETDRG